MAKIEYPTWKLIIWRYVRVFLAALLGSLAIDQLFLGTQDVVLSVMKSAVAAGIAAIAKLAREELGDNHPIVDKLVV